MNELLGSSAVDVDGGGRRGRVAEDRRVLVQAGRLLPAPAPLGVRTRLRRPPAHARQAPGLLGAQALLQEQ